MKHASLTETQRLMKNVIPAKAGIQGTKEPNPYLHGNDSLEVFSK
jgi:hypothetical protein